MIKLGAMEAKRLMSFYLTFLRALYAIEQNAHWQLKGDNFYGNHLLMQRLYETTSEDVDTAAEKTIGLFGALEDLSEDMVVIINKFDAQNYNGNWVQAVLKAEQAFLELSRTLYNTLKNNGAMTLGLDDMIMSISNSHEVHVYLLKQALEG